MSYCIYAESWESPESFLKVSWELPESFLRDSWAESLLRASWELSERFLSWESLESFLRAFWEIPELRVSWELAESFLRVSWEQREDSGETTQGPSYPNPLEPLQSKTVWGKNCYKKYVYKHVLLYLCLFVPLLREPISQACWNVPVLSMETSAMTMSHDNLKNNDGES